jgi:hypothetical protein
MAVDNEPLYYRNLNERDKYEKQEIPRTSSERFRREEYREKEAPREIKVERRTIHKMLKEEEMEPLKMLGPKVIGNLFDRVDFLKIRVNEVQTALDTRKSLHEELIKEIDLDIGDKQRLVMGLSDIDDVRDFKLDISSLRMEKRRENVQFWRDTVQLTTELRELLEEYQTESKIANLFQELKSGEQNENR